MPQEEYEATEVVRILDALEGTFGSSVSTVVDTVHFADAQYSERRAPAISIREEGVFSSAPDQFTILYSEEDLRCSRAVMQRVLDDHDFDTKTVVGVFRVGGSTEGIRDVGKAGHYIATVFKQQIIASINSNPLTVLGSTCVATMLKNTAFVQEQVRAEQMRERLQSDHGMTSIPPLQKSLRSDGRER